MTVKDANFEKGVADFFGDAEVAEKYMKLKSIEEKIKLIWTAPVIQVDIYLHTYKISYLFYTYPFRNS